MNARAYAGIALATVIAGAGLWWVAHPKTDPPLLQGQIAPAALWSATFSDVTGTRHALGELQGNVVVLNFWATWCAPCREEMPAFARLDARWQSRGVRFVGIANDDPSKVARFAEELGIRYPLWTGGDEVADLSRRLGNRGGVLPHTVILAPDGRVLEAQVGPYTEAALAAKLAVYAGKGG